MPKLEPSQNRIVIDKIETSSNLSSVANSTCTVPSTSGSEGSSSKPRIRNVKSATNSRSVPSKLHVRAATAKPKKQPSPAPLSGGKDREQGKNDHLLL